ncbi:hypothetical protein P3W45_000869 [Vairimorpha bombi]|jgi:hypothetical protein
MNILFNFFYVYSNIFPLRDNDTVEVFEKLSDRTVVLVKSTVMIENPHTKEWNEIGENIPTMTQLKIYKTDKQSDLSLKDKPQLFKDEKYAPHNGFFFISYKGAGLYGFEFKINTTDPNTYGLKIEMFEGNADNPEIMSGIDYHMSWLTQKLGDLLSFARNNFEIEEMGDQDEVEYVRLYNNIFKLVFRIFLLKIIVLIVTIFYVNKSVKKFFITHKIAK